MCDSSNTFTPFYSYTFDGYDKLPIPNVYSQSQINTISDLYTKRPIVSPGVYKLFKQDLEPVILNGHKTLRVNHPLFRGKDGFVVFSYYDIPDSQDTKSIYSAYVILGQTGVMNSTTLLKSCRVPFLMYMNVDGFLMDYKGGVNAEQLKYYIKSIY